ncbi:uncharacterized protein N7469_009169 [Penicillium citrinum]|uniref:Major facilitator superfamily (MFS) profile domain-containing protein n=1 Tax=Penicillium citrinum TaxID=5077 RepID=A0A9W9NMY9_PENCI|nr:uncharacterized protein N7469_009169 [Penicillium citrinum]KAJ5222929.1 hypothetical protein N7469_009169 [Penicillium citrinum]
MVSEPPYSSSGKTESPSHALTLHRHPSVASDETRTEEKFALGRRGILVVFTLCVLTLMAALDGTSISVALPPSFASFSNIFGRRPAVLAAVLFFCVGAIVSAVANNFMQMLVGRSIQGVGGGGIIALSEVIITDLVPLRYRGQYFGIFSAMWSIGSVTGPILGGGFAQNVTWRWIFYINFPFIGVGTIFVILFLTLRLAPSSLSEKLRRIDYGGTILFVGSLSSFLIPLTWGGVSYAWDSWRTLVPLLIGVSGLIAFMFYEYHWASEPIIPPEIFVNRTASVSFLGSVLQGLVMWCTLYYLPLYYEAVREYSPILSGVALFPQTFTVAPCAIVIGILITYTGKYRWAVWMGWVLSTIGLGLMCIIKRDTSVPGWIFLNIVGGLGLGALFPSLGYAVQASADPRNLSIAVAMFSFFRALGQAIGVAVGGVVFQNRMHDSLLKYPALAPMASAYSKDAAGLVQVIKAMPDGIDKINLKDAYTDSLRIVWVVCCAISAIALVFSLLTQDYDLDRALETEQGLGKNKAVLVTDKDLELNADRVINQGAPMAW